MEVAGYRVTDLRGTLPVREGARPYGQRPRAAITGVCLHHSGVDADSTAQELASYQTTKGQGDPFPAIAYHFVVRRDGGVEWCHDLETRTWHAGREANDRYVAVCLVGQEPTGAQTVAAGVLLRVLEAELGRPLDLKGHKDFMATVCPGQWWPAGRDLVRLAPDAGPPVVMGFREAYERLGIALCGRPLEAERGTEWGTEQEFERVLMRWLRQENRVWVHLK